MRKWPVDLPGALRCHMQSSSADGGTGQRTALAFAQIRKTIELTRSLAPDDLTPDMRDEYIAIYRHWRAGQGG
jgi:hypothetical protein